MKKILINILSEQKIQNLLAIHHFKPDTVLALSSIDYKNQVKIFEGVSQVKHHLLEIKAYNLAENLQILKQELTNWNEDQIVINYTGGTKIMALSAILNVLLSSSQQVELAYVNSRDLKVESIIVNRDKTLKSSKQSLKLQINIEEYFSIMGEQLDRMDDVLSKEEMERMNLSKKLMYDRMFAKIFKKQKSFFGKDKKPLKKHSLILDNIDIYWDEKELRIKTPGRLMKFNHGDGGDYLTGAWLEELVFDKMKQSEKFDECVKNIRVNYKEQNTPFNKNEIDVAVRKGFKTAFIECKAGKVTQDHVYKLKSITNHYLGTFGVAVLYSKFKPQPNIIEKCKDMGVHLFSGRDLKYMEYEIEKLLK